MTMHRYHPDPERGDPEDAILWDDCERCTQHARGPFISLDDDNVRALYARGIAVEEGDEYYRTRTEGRAAQDVYLTARRLEQTGLLVRHETVMDLIKAWINPETEDDINE